MKYLLLFGIQVALVAIGIGLLYVADYFIDGKCIGGLSISGMCVVDSVLITVLGSLGLSALFFALALFQSYFNFD